MSRTIYELLKEKPEITGEEIRNSMDFALEQVTENLAHIMDTVRPGLPIPLRGPSARIISILPRKT